MATACEPDLTFGRLVQERCQEPILQCYYCQKCSAGCPIAFAMDYKPAQVLRLVQLGQKDLVLGSTAIWMCVGCEACGTRCPNQIRLAPLFDTLRYMALEGGYKPEPAVYWLHRSFLDSIRLWGRVHEMSMLAQYKVHNPLGKDFIADMKVALYLFVKGKILSLPERVHRLAEVRRLYKRHTAAEVES